jgi:Ca2+-binding RTX toxin-like protein
VARPSCAGQEATIAGTSGNDLIRGTARPDVIVARAGADIVSGLGADDVVCSGPGADRVSGGDGDDLVFDETKTSGASSNDIARGGAGEDELRLTSEGATKAISKDASSDEDTGFGGPGDDVIFAADAHGGEGADVIRLSGQVIGIFGDGAWGGDGPDIIQGGLVDVAEPVYDGESGDDHIVIRTEDPVTALGGSGDDDLHAGLGDDNLYGQSGDDILSGNIGDDYLSGGSGSDELDGDTGTDSCNGGDDIDSAINCDFETLVP